MAYNHGVRVKEQATSLVAPVTGTAGLQVIIGTAPVNLAADPYKATNVPMIAYWTKTYSQTIGDVKVTSPNPVEVEIRFIMTDGELPTKTVIDGVAAYLQDENIRPLTDKVTVLAPETVKFNIAFTYYVNLSDQSKAGTIQAEVAQAVADYIEWQTRTIGRDINPSELMKRIVAAGAKRAEITSPVFTTVPDTSVARIGTQTVTYGGVEND